MAFRLRLIAQKQGPTVGLAGHLLETFAQQVVAILGARDFDIAIAGEFGVHEGDRGAEAVAGLVEAGGEEAGFESRGAQERLLGDSDALEGEELLGVDGLVEGDEVVLEMGDLLEVFEADDSEGGGGEAVFAGILRGAGLARRGPWAGGFGGVGAIGGELLSGNGSFGMRHAVKAPLQGVARRGAWVCNAAESSDGGERGCGGGRAGERSNAGVAACCSTCTIYGTCTI